MSLINPDPSRQAAGLPEAIQHRLVLCTGYPSSHPDRQGGLYLETPENRSHDSTVFIREVRGFAPYVLALYGSLDSDSMSPLDRGEATVNKIYEYVRGVRNAQDERTSRGFFDPRGKIILYGFSAGGFNVVYACRGIDRWWYRYGVQGQRGTLQLDNDSAPFDPAAGARVQVDYLITVDPCASDVYGEGWDKRVAGCVPRAQNWFQQTPGQQYRGVQLEQTNPRQVVRNTLVEFNSRGGPAIHFDMVGITHGWAISKIRENLNL